MSDEILDQYEKTLEAAVVPSYFLPEQFCNNGVQSVDYIIPPAFSANPKQASLETGAPPLQQVKPNLGGAYFPRQEYNGILRLVTNILAYLNSGYNFTFDTKNTGGYQSNAVLFDYATGKWVQSLQDGNTNNFVENPNLIDGTHWKFITVNPNVVNDFTVSPNIPTPPLDDNSLKAINSAYFESNAAGATKYNFPISCKNTPTFAADEEYVLTVGTLTGEVDYQLLFQVGYAVPNAQSMTSISFSLTHSGVLASHTGYQVVVKNICAEHSPELTQAQLNDLFSFNVYVISDPIVINGAVVAGQIVTIKLNSNIIQAAPGQETKLIGLIATPNLSNYTGATNPNSQALLGITNGVLELATRDLTDKDGLPLGAVLTPTYVTNTNVANMTNNNIVKWLNGIMQDSGIAVANIATVEQLQNETFAAILLSLVAMFGTFTAGVVTKSLVIYGNQPTNPVNFAFAGNGSAGAGAYIEANYDNVNQVSFINFPYKLSDGITLARPCLGNSNAASDQIAKLADITANGGGIVASGGSDGAMWVLFANGLILQTAAVQVALVPNGTASGSIALPKSITNRTTYNIQSSFGAGALVNGRISADIPGTTTITYSVYNNNANTGNQIIEFFVWSY